MNCLVKKEVERITRGELWADIKKGMSHGDKTKLTLSYVRADVENKKTSMDLAAGRIALVRINVVDWNLTDENDKKLPITDEIIEQLDPDIGEWLTTEIDARNPVPKAPAPIPTS